MSSISTPPSISRKWCSWCQNRYGPKRCSSTNSDGSRTWVISVTHPTETHGIGRTRYVTIIPGYILTGRSEVGSSPSEGGVIRGRFRGSEKKVHASGREIGRRCTSRNTDGVTRRPPDPANPATRSPHLPLDPGRVEPPLPRQVDEASVEIVPDRRRARQ